VAVSDEISSDILKEAYGMGIFPWPYEEHPLLWFSPDPRGLLFFKKFHVSQSFRKFLKKSNWNITWNQSFAEVVEACSQPRKDGTGTWITEDLKKAYLEFHNQGYAHSVEVRDPYNNLVGGLYGVYVDGSFSGESMFYHQPQASKVALWALITELREIGLEWLDIQMVTPHLEKMGGEYWPRQRYYKLLEESQNRISQLKSLSFQSESVVAIFERWCEA
jgi:leucyl/phenylalanyl-tRNA--protein transferase